MKRLLLLLCSSLCLLTACQPKNGSKASSSPAQLPPDKVVELLLPYGSEKESWLNEVTTRFNADNHTIGTGKTIRVKLRPMGSGDCIDEVLAGRIQAHLVSPASMAFVEMANLRARQAAAEPLFTTTDTLIVSPVVIAMWEPMARTLGWPAKRLGWADLIDITAQPEGWGTYGKGEWGRFKLGHTHPGYSNSGLLAVLAEVYAATGKTAGLTAEDLQAPTTRDYVASIERSIVHYGTSTGFFAKRIAAGGPGYLSAAVLYESNVIEANLARGQSANPPLVAIYPREGTFWSDHPIGVVNRPRVTAEHREAATQYVRFLLAPAQQQRALALGFRPASIDVPLGAPVEIANGVDPAEPRTTLQVPKPELLQAALDLWTTAKKPANVTLVLDVSGSMQQGDALGLAKEGARDLLASLTDRDRFGLLLFNERVQEVLPSCKLDTAARHQAEGALGRARAEGGTALYDALAQAMKKAQAVPPDEIAAIILLSDGADTQSQLKLEALLPLIAFDAERRPVRIFTIGYGKQAPEILRKIAESTQAKNYTGDKDTIRAVFRDIATFF